MMRVRGFLAGGAGAVLRQGAARLWRDFQLRVSGNRDWLPQHRIKNLGAGLSGARGAHIVQAKVEDAFIPIICLWRL